MAKNALEKYKQLVQDQGQVLLDVVQSVALGDLDVEIEVPEGVEVLSDLSIGIEMMVDDIREMLAEQEQSRVEIEQARRQAEIALQETLALQQRYLGQEWQGLLRAADQGYFRFEEQEGPTDEVWLPAMTEAVQQVTSITEDDEEGATLAVPLHLYGQVIGALGLNRPGGEPWSPDDIHAVQEIVEQVAWALENQRLFDDAQLASLLMSQRVNELDCLNAIGRRIDESPPIAEFLEWVARRIPSAMRYPDICRVAIEFEGQVYGVAEALELPRQIVAGMHIGGERPGQITIAYTEDRDFIDEESALMGDIIRRVSGYIEKQRLFDQAQARVREQTILSEMGRALSARLDVDAVVRNIHRYASRLVDAASFYVALYDAQRDEISFPLFLREEKEHQQESRRSGKGLTEYVIQNREPLLIREDVMAWLEDHGIEAIGVDAYSWLGVPMMVGEQVIGLIAVQSYTTPRLYDEHDRDLLAAIASQAAIAITNARLFDDAQLASLLMSQRVNELDCLNAIGRRIDESPPIAEFLEWVAQRIPSAMRYPDICRVAIEFEGQVYGVVEALEMPRQIVAGMHIGGERLGRVTIAYTEDHDFINEESALMGDIIRRVSGYIEKQRLFDQAQARAREQTILSEMGRALSARLDVDAVVENIYRHASRLVDTTNFYIALYDAQRNEISFPLYTQEGQERQVGGRQFGKGLTEHVIQTCEPLLIKEDIAGQLQEVGIEAIGREAFSWLGVPMVVGEQVIGVIAIQSHTTPRLYDEHDRDLLVAIASQAAIAITNARLFDQAQARVQEQTTLSEMGRALSARLDVDAVVRNIHRYTSRVMDATSYYVALYDVKRDVISFPLYIWDGQERPQESRRSGKGLTEYVIHNREPLLIKEDVVAWLEERGVEGIGLEAHSWLGVPMMVGEQVIGVIAVQSDTSSRLYDEHDRDLLVAIASQAAIAITNANLFEQTRNVLAQTEEQARRLAMLNEMSAQLSSTANLDEILQVAATQVSHILPSDRVSVTLLTAEGDSCQVFALQGEAGAVSVGTQVLLQGSSIEVAVREKRLVSVLETEADDLGGIRSLMVAPLFEGGQAVGTLNIGSKQTHTYGPRDENLLLQIASTLSSAMENRRLFEQTQAQLANLTTIQQTTSELTAALTFDEAVAALLSQVANAVQADTVSMFLIEGELMRRVGRYPDDESVLIGQTIALADYPLTHRVVQTRQANAITVDDPRLQEHARQSFKAAGITANATIPLIGREGVLGTLALSSQQPGRVFTQHDVQILQTLADQATLAIERVRLLDETARRAHRERTLREITARVRGSTNPDVIVRTAVRELGSALGRPTFVRLGSVEQLVRKAGGNGGDLAPTLSHGGGESHA